VSALRRARARSAPLFLLPALVLLGLFLVWPLARALVYSFEYRELLRPDSHRFAGLTQYSELLVDPRFQRAFENTAVFAVLVVPLQTTLALLLALWVNRPEPAWRFLRAVFFAPTVVAMPVLAVLWTILYQPAHGGEVGPVNALIMRLGLPPLAFLGDPRLALPAVAAMSIWQGVGLQMLVFLAGLKAIPRDLIDAARMDGAGAFERLWFVTLPALRNTLIFVLTVTTVLAFRLFVQPYLMTHGGPQGSTRSLIQCIYEMTFLSQDLGRACAAAFLFLGWVAIIALVQRGLLREERT
jgi:ABC-type sugar transport system permease subunit